MVIVAVIPLVRIVVIVVVLVVIAVTIHVVSFRASHIQILLLRN